MRYLRVLFLLTLVSVPCSPVFADEWHYSNVDRIVAVGDIHGAYDALVETLQAAEVIDSRLAWSGGKTHLVFTGDMLDRGARSRQVMDLIMQLEKSAKRSGGRVHLLLGNHEVMNLNGDLRYVAEAEYAAYQDIESSKERERWFKDYLGNQTEVIDEAVVRAEFDTLAPPGYFGHRKAFRHNGVYGRWLLKKPFIVVINETAFVHGGLPYFVADHGLEGANVGLKNDLSYYVQAKDRLADKRFLNPVYRFKEIPSLLQERREAGQVPGRYENLVQAALDLSKSPLHTPIGPTWYRGTATCSTLVEGDVLDAVFEKIDASRVVMGHTSTTTRQVQQRGGGRSVEIDTGMLAEVYKGSGNALVFEGGAMTVVNQDGRTGLSPVAHPIRVGSDSPPLDDEALAIVLAEGIVDEVSFEGESLGYFEVSNGEVTVFARFHENRDDDSAPELAAYRLDRMLGLGMIPVTARREVEGKRGALQLYQRTVELVGMMANMGAPCSFDKQVSAMRVFDALIGNSSRMQSSILFDPEDMLLMLVDHSSAFGNGENQPGHSMHTGLTVGKQWQIALRSLDDETLQAALGDVLGEQQLKALEQRRDALLDSPIARRSD